MTEAQRRASIARHAPFLTPQEHTLFMPAEAELRATNRSYAIARTAGALLRDNDRSAVKAAFQAMAAQAVNVALAIVLVTVWLGLGAYLDSKPSETDAAAVVALDLNDAIHQAQAAAKDHP